MHFNIISGDLNLLFIFIISSYENHFTFSISFKLYAIFSSISFDPKIILKNISFSNTLFPISSIPVGVILHPVSSLNSLFKQSITDSFISM